MVSTLRCGRNNPGSNPGLCKYYIIHTVLHPKKPIMRAAVRKYYIAFEVRILVSGRFCS